MLLPLFLNNLLQAYRLPVDEGVYEVIGQDVKLRVGYPAENIFKQGGAAASIAVMQTRPDIIFGASAPMFKIADPEIVTPSATKRVRPTITTIQRRRKPS